MTIIYALTDPRNGKIRYVGKSNDTYLRLKSHMSEARRNSGTHRLNWLRQLLNLSLDPILTILEEVEDEDWQDRERYWIAYGRSVGWPLTNATAGGKGANNPSKATRKKLSKAAMGKRYAAGKRTKEFRLQQAEYARGNQNAKGHTVSKDARKGISAALKRHFQENPPPVGEKVKHAKLRTGDVKEIRRIYRLGEVSYRKLAKQYGMSYQGIRKVVMRKTWTHVN